MNLKGAKVVVTIPSDEAAEPAREPMPARCKFVALFLFVMGIAAILEYDKSLGADGVGAIVGTAALMVAVMGS